MSPAPSAERTLAVLEDVLLQELDRYRDLLDILLKENNILTSDRPETRPELIEAQKRVLLDARELEPRRVNAMSRMGVALGLARTPTLRELSQQLAGNDRARVEKLREAFAHVVPRVDRVNRINVLLIRNRMSFISSTVRAILEESIPHAPTHAPTAQATAQNDPSSWTDRRV